MADPVDQYFLALQTALAGRYSLDRELGRGGMGVVYLAREVRLDRSVALKVLPPHLAALPELRERFLREARTAARLSHPNIIPIYSVDEVGDFVFFTMAFVQGETLGQRVRVRGPLPPGEAVRILKEAAWALAYAHAQGVVHRDVKPDNILLESGSGRTLVADFGIAQVLHATGLTGAGEIVGTPEFMSPEQASGSEVDARSDVYSLGAVGYFALSGRLPFEGPSVQSILAQHITRPAPPVTSAAPGVPRKVARIIDQCLVKEPAARFMTGEALADALDRALGSRQELPVPIRLWLARGNSLEFTYGASIATWWSFAALFYFGTLLDTGGVPIPRSLYDWALLVLMPISPILLLPLFAFASLLQTRRLLAAGYGLEDVRSALGARLAERREELAFPATRTPSWLARWLRGIARGGMGVSVGSILVLLAVPRLAASTALSILFQGGIGVFAAATLLSAMLPGGLTVKDWVAEWRMKFWNGRAGRWFIGLAGRGLARGALATDAAHRPTEIAIGFAAEGLFRALPKAIRDTLRELPEVVRQLESRAQMLRRQVENLTEMAADADAADALARSPALQLAEPGLASHREALIADLGQARDAALQRLSMAVAALETIRLDLLRLQGGLGSVATISAALNAARDVSDQIDRLLEGRREAEEVGTPTSSTIKSPR